MSLPERHSSHLRVAFTLATLSLGGLASACIDTQSAPGGRLELAVAPLTLPGISYACYDLRVQNDLEETVWSQGTAATSPADTKTLCSNRFGNGAGGDISYVGTCDATEADPADGKTALNRVTLWVDGLYDASGADIGEYRNPCEWPTGCSLSFECEENADVQVAFDLAVMRSAKQGFFDIGVDFEDIFCSAKADTCYADPLTPIELVAHSGRPGATDADGDGRFLTGVGALACTSGAGATADTLLRMSAAEVVCANGNSCSLAPAGTAGNNQATCTGGAQVAYAIYRGVEQLACDGGAPGSCQKLFWNLAVNLEDLAAAGFSDCELRYDATATTAAHPTFSATTPGVLVGANVTYPVIHFAAPLLAGSTPTCGAHALDADTVVTTDYLHGCDASLDGCTLPALCNTLSNQAGVAVATACASAPANQAPIVANGLVDSGGMTDQYFEYVVAANTFSDPEGQTLTLSASVGNGALPGWLLFDGSIFSGTPGSGDTGEIEISVTATDPGGATVTTTFTLTIDQANHAPEATEVTIPAVVEGETFVLDLTPYVSDPDGDTLFIVQAFGLDGSSFDGLTLTLSPGEGYGGQTYNLFIEISDGTDSVWLYPSVEVRLPNRAPTFNYAGASGSKYAPFTFDLTNAFSDPDGDTLTFTFGVPYGPFPTGTTISGNLLMVDPSSTGTPNGTGENQIGEYWYVNVIATDPGGLVADNFGSPTLVAVYANY